LKQDKPERTLDIAFGSNVAVTPDFDMDEKSVLVQRDVYLWRFIDKWVGE
jgi:hypothetical protein